MKTAQNVISTPFNLLLFLIYPGRQSCLERRLPPPVTTLARQPCTLSLPCLPFQPLIVNGSANHANQSEQSKLSRSQRAPDGRRRFIRPPGRSQPWLSRRRRNLCQQRQGHGSAARTGFAVGHDVQRCLQIRRSRRNRQLTQIGRASCRERV